MFSTTILSIRKGKHVVFAGDGQVSLQHTVVKNMASKIRKFEKHRILIGFAGNAADAMILFDMFEKKIKVHTQLTKAAIELIKSWRNASVLKKLDALLLVADSEKTLLISGAGDILEPDIDICAIGSGGNYALSAARALLENTNMPIDLIAKKAISIASDICIYTNKNITIKSL
jgi:ATP-dependent HslUV protease subunit HslV